MSNEPYGVTQKGFVPKRLDVILKEVYRDLADGFGFDVSLNPQSFLNVLVVGFADQLAELWELGQNVYLSQYPSSAEGLSLDNAVQYGGIKRAGNQKTYYPILCTGDDGTIVPAGTILQSNTKPAIRFVTNEAKTITRSDFNQAKIRVVAVQTNSVYTIGVNGTLYSFSSGSNPTEKSILLGLAAKIQHPDYAVSMTDGLEIRDRSTQKGNTLLLSENLTTESISTIVLFGSEHDGKCVLPEESITGIVTNLEGLHACTNLAPPIYGRMRETDVELRQSYIKRIAVRSFGMLESITSAILDHVQGVESIIAYENDTNITDADGRPPHSIEVIVDGGSEVEIAQQILAKKAAGIQTYGSVKVEIPDHFNAAIPIRFNRPEYVAVWLRVTLTVNPQQAMPPNYAELTKQAILDQYQDAEAGKSIFTQMVIGDIYRTVTGISFVEIKAFSSSTPGVIPKDFPDENIVVTARQKAVVDPERIEVRVKHG